MKRTQSGEPGVAKGFAGRLDDASPIEIGQFLLLGRKTGALHLAKEGNRGALFVRDGDVVAAVGPEMRTGVEAAIEILRWTSGTFRFVPEPVGARDEIGMGTQNLLLETARRMDEAGAELVQRSLEEVDELSRTFAAITGAQQRSVTSVAGEHMKWVLEEPGRRLFQLEGHPITGMMPNGEAYRFEGAQPIDAKTLLGEAFDGPPQDRWFMQGDRRLYVSWGADGFRIVHPHERPEAAAHLSDPTLLETLVGTTSPVAIYGQPGSGKSLLAALLAARHAARGARVIYVSGIPTHDVGDGIRIVHVTSRPGCGLEGVREAVDRWRPEAVVMDADGSEAAGSILRDLRISGTRLAVTLRTPDRASARESLRLMVGGGDGWRYFAPWPVAPGPLLDVSREAA